MSEAQAVLIIDDNTDDRALYQRSLEDAPGNKLRLVEAASGESGLRAIEEETPRCVLLDYSLPGRNGIEILRRIRAKHPHLPVVMLTGQGNETIAVQSMKEGAQDYIVKSTITPEMLQHVIRSAIEHGILQKNIHEQRTSLEIFSRALAHDLKEPVRTIKSFLTLLSTSESFSEKGQGHFAIVRSAADRMAALIDAVYFYTRLDGSVQQVSKELCDVAAVVEDAKADIGELIRERKAFIVAGKLPTVYANRRQLSQLLQNLLCNAIQHSQTPVTIRIDAIEEMSEWSFRVSDDGPGIDQLQREKIFEPFKRLAHSKANGLGLGLAICKRIVEAHGGKIWCEPGLRRGTTFVFSIPADIQVPALQACISPQPSFRPGGVLTYQPQLANILLVDDSEGDIELTKIMLLEKSKLRCNLLVARDAYIAMEMLRQGTPEISMVNLLLLDINMPGMDGFELLEYIHENVALRDLPVVVCSTSAYDKDMERAKSLGALGYIVKPADLGKLRPLVDRASKLHLVEDAAGYALHQIM